MTSARDRLEAVLDRIESGRSGKHVFVKLYPEAARAAADAADARRRAGVSLGPLDGVLVSIKDLFDVAGEPTTAGSTILRDAAPAKADAPVVARLRRAGAVVLAKTNMVEFAFGGIGLNPHYGTPGNAADPARIPGGSTSGGGVSAGEGTSEIAIGSDTGGSVRIPAAFNGIVGFKPTAKRVPLDGAFPLSYALDFDRPARPHRAGLRRRRRGDGRRRAAAARSPPACRLAHRRAARAAVRGHGERGRRGLRGDAAPPFGRGRAHPRSRH